MSSSDDSDKSLMTARPPPGSEASDVYSASTVAGRASSDLLDLVRDAEEGAKLSSRGTPPSPSSASKFHAAPAIETEKEKDKEKEQPKPKPQYVDVDDEAVDAPPSIPIRSAGAAAGAPPPHARTAARSSRPPPPVFTPIEPLRIAPLKALQMGGAAASSSKQPAAKRVSHVSPANENVAPGWPPIVSIGLMFALAAAALAFAAR